MDIPAADALADWIDQHLPTASGREASALAQWKQLHANLRRQYEAAVEEAGKPFTPKRSRLNQGEFRLLFTFEERNAETAFEQAARSAALAGTATPEQVIYLTMREDYRDAGWIDLDDPAVIAALDFYVAFGLLTEERRNYVLTGYRPGEMPEPEEPEEPEGEGEGDADPA